MSIKIKAITPHNLRNSANMAFHFDVVALIIEYVAARLNIVALFAVYQAAVVRQDEAYKKIVKSKFTEKIADADRARDKVYKNITKTIYMLLDHHNPDIVAIAKELKILIDTYKNLNRKSYNEQTGDIINILQEFRGTYAADIETIRIPELVDELERANNEMDALVKERDLETVGKNHEPMKAAREASDAAYQDIVERINAAIVMEGPENYAEFIARLNLLVDKYKLLITKSHHHAKPAEPAAKAKAKKPEQKKPEPKAKEKAKPKPKKKENKE